MKILNLRRCFKFQPSIHHLLLAERKEEGDDDTTPFSNWLSSGDLPFSPLPPLLDDELGTSLPWLSSANRKKKRKTFEMESLMRGVPPLCRA